jgi:hypothetical protein
MGGGHRRAAAFHSGFAMDLFSAPDYALARFALERGVAAVYLIAFVSALNQFPALLGEKGFLPVPDYLARRSFRTCPTLFHWRYSDRLFRVVAWTGAGLSALALVGVTSSAPLGVGLTVWLVLGFLYLSIINVGQRFYGFGWESMLVEAGFFIAFLAPASMTPSWIPLLIFRWMLFRVELGAGLIKLRVGGPWLDRTALDYHHETQPMPNPLSRLAHHLPRPLLHGGVVFSHFAQVIVPFGLFLPQPVAGIAGLVIIAHQLLLIIAGNYSWLNWLTVALALTAFSNEWFAPWAAADASAGLADRPPAWDIVLLGLLAATVLLSIRPARNLCSKRQRMNCCFNSWHLVNAYGAFGSMTKKRYEIVIEGTRDADAAGGWEAYEFKGKPGDPRRVPPQVAPYHLRLDWLMWFLPLSVRVGPRGIAVPGYEPWFLRFLEKLLRGDGPTRRLMKHDPFSDEPPKFLRARFYRYRFTTRAEKRDSGCIWNRELIDEYLRPVNLEQLARP